eukprot:g1786.t1
MAFSFSRGQASDPRILLMAKLRDVLARYFRSPYLRVLATVALWVGYISLAIFHAFDRPTEIEEHGLIPGFHRPGFFIAPEIVYDEDRFRGSAEGRLENYGSGRTNGSFVLADADGQDNYCERTAETGADVVEASSADRNRAETLKHIEAELWDFGLSAREVREAAAQCHALGLYTIAASRRGDRRERIALVLELNFALPIERNTGLVALGVRLADYLARVHWLARDTVVAFLDSSRPYGEAAKRLLHTYYEGMSHTGSAGLLRQAIFLNLDAAHAEHNAEQRPSDGGLPDGKSRKLVSSTRSVVVSCNDFLLDIEGVNGFLPNQDILNAYIREGDAARRFLHTSRGVSVRLRPVWESLAHMGLRNGGVHAGHSVFLTYQIPSFTVRADVARRPGVDKKNPGESSVHAPLELFRTVVTEKTASFHPTLERGQTLEGRTERMKVRIGPALQAVAASVEGILRDYSNVLQQLHHSFNTYVMTGLNSHVSSGLYYYPVFAIQAGMVLLLLVIPDHIPFRRDFRGILQGVFILAAVVTASGVPLLLWGRGVVAKSAIADGTRPGRAGAALESSDSFFVDDNSPSSMVSHLQLSDFFVPPEVTHAIAGVFAHWSALRVSIERALASRAENGFTFRNVLLTYVFDGAQTLFLPAAYVFALRTLLTRLHKGGFGVSLQSAAAFVFTILLGALTVYHYALGVFLTTVMTPPLLLVVPFHYLRTRARNSWVRRIRYFLNQVVVVVFLIFHALLFFVPTKVRREQWRAPVAEAVGVATKAVYWEVMPDYHTIPKLGKMRPDGLVLFLEEAIPALVALDVPSYLRQVALDHAQVGGLVFPVLCLIYDVAPQRSDRLYVVSAWEGGQRDSCAETQKMERDVDDLYTLQEVKAGLALFVVVLTGCVVGGTVWKRTSSSGVATWSQVFEALL